MKVKEDFITNSSSISFCVYGVSFSDGINDLKCVSLKQRILQQAECESVEDVEDMTYYIEKELEKTGDLDFYYDMYDNDFFAMGLGLENMKDQETLSKFKQKVLRQLNQAGVDCALQDIKLIQEAFAS